VKVATPSHLTGGGRRPAAGIIELGRGQGAAAAGAPRQEYLAIRQEGGGVLLAGLTMLPVAVQTRRLGS
jgi:hypothetical protein